MTTTPLAPSDAERAEWPDNTRNYAEWLESEFFGPDPDSIDLTNPGNIPFGKLPRATQEAMVIAHVLDEEDVEWLCDGKWVDETELGWNPFVIFRVAQP